MKVVFDEGNAIVMYVECILFTIIMNDFSLSFILVCNQTLFVRETRSWLSRGQLFIHIVKQVIVSTIFLRLETAYLVSRASARINYPQSF